MISVVLTTEVLVDLCAQSLCCVQLFVTLWTVASQAPLSMGLSRQEEADCYALLQGSVVYYAY